MAIEINAQNRLKKSKEKAHYFCCFVAIANSLQLKLMKDARMSYLLLYSMRVEDLKISRILTFFVIIGIIT